MTASLVLMAADQPEPYGNILEVTITLSYVAAVTDRIWLGRVRRRSARVPLPVATRRCVPPSTGASTCARKQSASYCAASQYSAAASPWTASRRCVATRSVRLEQVVDLLDQLVDHSFVSADTRHEQRFDLLETIRQYALEHPEQAGEILRPA